MEALKNYGCAERRSGLATTRDRFTRTELIAFSLLLFLFFQKNIILRFCGKIGILGKRLD